MCNKIKIGGDGLQSAFSGKEASFYVDCQLITYKGHLEVIIIDSNLNQVLCFVEPDSVFMGIYNVKYVPPYNISSCTVEIMFDKIIVFDKPLMVPISLSCDDTFSKVNTFQKGNLKSQ